MDLEACETGVNTKEIVGLRAEVLTSFGCDSCTMILFPSGNPENVMARRLSVIVLLQIVEAGDVGLADDTRVFRALAVCAARAAAATASVSVMVHVLLLFS